MNESSRLDSTGTICYIKLQDLKMTPSDDIVSLAQKAVHLKELIELAESQLWDTECRLNELEHKPTFALGEIVNITHENKVVGHHVGKITQIEPTPDSFRYTLTIHKIYWKVTEPGKPDESRYRSVQRFQSDLWIDPEKKLTDTDMIPRKYRVETPARSAEKSERTAPPRSEAELDFLAKMRAEL